MRGEYDGMRELRRTSSKFFEKLPNPDKTFAVMPGIAHASFQQKNYMIAYHILLSFFTQPEPIYSTYKPGEAASTSTSATWLVPKPRVPRHLEEGGAT